MPGPQPPRAFNIVIAGRAARTSTHDRHSRIRCLEAVLLCYRIEIWRGNVSTHVESPDPGPHALRPQGRREDQSSGPPPLSSLSASQAGPTGLYRARIRARRGLAISRRMGCPPGGWDGPL
jgi:hypothetical protein